METRLYNPDGRVDTCAMCERVVDFDWLAIRQPDNSLIPFCSERCRRDYKDVNDV